ncbi:MAG: DUF2341 domain-containing protein, partial [Burkholderiales bacterium]
MKPFLLALSGLLCAAIHEPCAAWWNKDWINRNKVSIASTAAVADAPVLVRLHTGNFPFADAKVDGSDVRFVAGDDNTPLKFHIEKWDGINELAFVWVRVPALAAGAPTDLYIYSGNAKGVGAEDTKGTWDSSQVAAFHFEEAAPSPVDQTANAIPVASFSAAKTNNALIGGGLSFDGRGGMTLAASPALAFGAGFSFSAWIKPAAAQAGAVLFRQQEGDRPIEIGMQGARLYVRAGSANLSASADMPLGAWKHVAVTVSDRILLYVDGVEMGAAPASPGTSSGSAEIAANFAGEMDELLLANQPRAAPWISFAAK